PAGAEDVACDVCTGTRLKAVKSCLVCLVSYCGKHLQPHYQSATFEKHRLVDPTRRLQESLCPHHEEVMRMFCRTDQQLICYVCPVDEHKGHDTVSAAAERTERQKELMEVQKNIQQRIQEREKDFQVLEEEVAAVNRSADTAVEDIDTFFTELLQLLDRRCSDGRQQVRNMQDSEVSQARGLQEKLQEEISELRRRNDQLQELFLTEDHNRFLHSYPSLSHLREPADAAATQVPRPKHFEDMTVGLSKVQQQLESLLGQDWFQVPDTATAVVPSQPPPLPQPRSRADFQTYSCRLTLDPETAHPMVTLSDCNRRATYMSDAVICVANRERFLGWYQVLSKERMAGRCYFEVTRKGRVFVAVAYNSISRGHRSNESRLGFNRQSWALSCEKGTCVFYHNTVATPLVGVGCSQIGVYVDHSAGILSFYGISSTTRLIHSIQTAFTEPLHAG
ncbi:unnamed protein product, partial [Tetraodon nigroviridis]